MSAHTFTGESVAAISRTRNPKTGSEWGTSVWFDAAVCRAVLAGGMGRSAYCAERRVLLWSGFSLALAGCGGLRVRRSEGGGDGGACRAVGGAVGCASTVAGRAGACCASRGCAGGGVDLQRGWGACCD